MFDHTLMISEPAYKQTLTRDEFAAACAVAKERLTELAKDAVTLPSDDTGPEQHHTAKIYPLKLELLKGQFLEKVGHAQAFDTQALFHYLRDYISASGATEGLPPDEKSACELSPSERRENIAVATQLLVALDLRSAFIIYNRDENRKSTPNELC